MKYAIFLLLCACVSTTSAGNVVANVRNGKDGLEVQRCELVTKQTGVWIVWQVTDEVRVEKQHCAWESAK